MQTRPNKIHQLVHTLSYGDAISSEVLALKEVFNSLGFESEIYSINVHPKLQGRAIDYRDFVQQQGDAFNGKVILHYSLGSPLNVLYRDLKQAERCLVYHNLTPADWFKGVNPRIVRDIEQGIAELPGLLKITDLIVADSKFNAYEIESLGYKAKVLDLPIDPARWNLEACASMSALVRKQGGVNLLHVGRLAPNKCIEDIIKIFYFYHHYIDRNSRLWLVGIDIDTELYSFGLRRLAHELGVHNAISFAGCMDDAGIRALYENCSVYLCMSEHEGFCLPVIEAMHFGLPVIAYASSALPDTIGSGGLLVNEKHHGLIAELINSILTDSQLRAELIHAGKQRVQELSYQKFKSRVEEIFGSALAVSNVLSSLPDAAEPAAKVAF